MDLGLSEYGEYRTHYNALDNNPDILDSEKAIQSSSTKRSNLFFEDSMRFFNIQKFWRIPSNLEILKLIDSNFEKLREYDFKACYAFENKNGEMTPNMKKNSQHKLIKYRIPKLQFIDDMQGTENFMG